MWLLILILTLVIIFLINKNTIEHFNSSQYLKNPVSLQCVNSTHPSQKILDVNNEILPKIKIFKPYLLNKNFHPDLFKKKLTNFPLDKRIVGKFIQLPNSQVSYWKKTKLSLLPKQQFSNIVNYNKKKLDYLFTPKNSKIISKKIIRVLKFQNWYLFHYIIDYYVPGNPFAFRLYLESYINQNTIRNSNIDLIAIISEDKFLLQPAYNETIDNRLRIYNKFPEIPYRASNHYMRDDNYTNTLLSKKKKQKILNRRGLKKIGMRCYGGIGELKKYCESNTNYLGKSTKKGTWDTPCQKDEECPFYQANKNYPNKRGGCIQGKCEMPLNVRRKGARYYDPNFLPFCYNCKSSEATCCKKQLKEQPNLHSPDFSFENDMIERITHKKLLEKLHLKIF